MMLRLIAYAALLLVLTGCMTAQQRAEWMERDYGAQCRKLGHVPASAEYQRCLQILRNAEVMDSLQMDMGF